jgi:hypothetical protein
MQLSDFDFSPTMMRSMIERAKEIKNPKYQTVLEDFVKYHESRGNLTHGQKAYASSIYCSLGDIAMERFRSWKVKLANDKEYRERVRVVSEYYLTAGYYSPTATRCRDYLLDSSNRLPDYSAFERMFNNEYANNVWESHKAEPKFAIGDLVRTRANADHPRHLHLVDSWMVIAIGNKPITKSHVYNEKLGGTKLYELLEVGGTRVVTVIEKQLKKHRVPKTKKRT